MDTEWKRTLADGTEVVRTGAWSPPGCHPVGCGLRLHVKDGTLVKVEGDPEHPVTKGRTCIRCLALPEYVNHPNRITHPLKRAREDRGKDAWVQISWDEALDIAATNLEACREKYGYEGAVLFNGTGRSAAVHSAFSCYNVLQTPNFCYAFSGYSCYGPRIAATAFVVGSGIPELDYASGFWDRYQDERFEVPNYILVWGKNPLKGNSDGLWGHCLIELVRKGAKLIVVDPRMTWLATRADQVLRLRPGTDAALGLGLLNVVINEDLYDHEFVDLWTLGFEQLAERVQEYPPEKVEEITGVPADKIRLAARSMAQKPSSTTWGVAIDENNNGIQAAQALLSLQAITGNLDIPGGTSLGPLGFDNAAPQDHYPTKVSLEAFKRKVGRGKFPAFDMIVNAVQPDYLLEVLETDDPYPLRFAWLQSSNLLAPTCSAQPGRWHDALLRMDFNMVTDLFMTPTAMALADLFLPVAAFPEGIGVVFTHFGMNTTVVSAINKAVEVGEAKSDVEIGFMFAKRLNPDLYPQSVEELTQAYFDGMSGMCGAKDWHELQTWGTALVPSEYKKYEKGKLRPDGSIGFNTPSGRVELYSSMFEYSGEDPLPHYIEPHMSPLSTPEYEFILTTGSRNYTSFHSEHRQVPSLRAIDPDPILEMNPADAARKGFEDGIWVTITNKYGKASFKLRITPIIKAGVVNAYHGWWFPEEEGAEPHLFGNWRSNVNQLCPSGDNSIMGFGAPIKCMMCDISTADEAEVRKVVRNA